MKQRIYWIAKKTDQNSETIKRFWSSDPLGYGHEIVKECFPDWEILCSIVTTDYEGKEGFGFEYYQLYE